jgi:23S rRNA (adenine2503-C2)-methyltransferase
MDNQKVLILDLNKSALESWMASIDQPAYRMTQIWKALYQQYKKTPKEITTLPANLRNVLGETYEFQALDPVRTIESGDHLTIKTLFKLWDGQLIEAVLMYYDQRRTLCISSQAGCGMGCSFCATGQMGFKRNLSSGEILAQVLYYARLLAEKDDHVTNIVVMGMGEPFHNYDNVMEALDRLNDPEAFGLGARHITLSTVGLIPNIRQFADTNTQFNLAISLHTVDNVLRSKMMPVNKKYPVEDLLNACRYYVKKTKRRITFEYALIEGINDSDADAKALADRLRGLLCHVNLIPLNPTRGFAKQGTQEEQVRTFAAVLDEHHIPCSVRLRRGIEIQAGCGQLATEAQSE